MLSRNTAKVACHYVAAPNPVKTEEYAAGKKEKKKNTSMDGNQRIRNVSINSQNHTAYPI